MDVKLDLEKEYGIVFDGGGARGAYQIGAWKALAEAGVKINAVAGTSVGALNGALLCMGDVAAAEQIWKNITYSDVMEIDDTLMEEVFDEEEPVPVRDLLKELWGKVKDGGVDITPLKELISKQVDEEVIRSSGKAFCLVTYSMTDRKALELGLEEIPEGELADFLLASAYLIGFKNEPLGGKKYMDGGIVNNVPTRTLVERGYQNLIEVRIFGPGVARKAEVPEEGVLYSIEPRVSLGSIIEFSPKRSRQNLKIGYFDAKRLIYGLEGSIYYIEQTQEECYYEKIAKSLGDLEARELRLRLKLPLTCSEKELVMGMLEASAKLLRVPKYKIYTVEELWEQVRGRYAMASSQQREEFPGFVQRIAETGEEEIVTLNREAYQEPVWAGQTRIYYEETDSTNLRAKELGGEGIHGTLVLADRQTAGRGRKGRVWESAEEENIYMSLYLRPEFSPEKAPMLTLVMAYSVAKALQKTLGMEAQIKWPNDLILNKKKICGILTEMTMEGWQIQSVVIGVGINLGNQAFPEELEACATSIWIETGKRIPKSELIDVIMAEFEQQYEAFCQAGDLSPIVEDYNQILVNREKEVLILDAKGEYTAWAEGINAQGELLIEKEDGTKEHIFAGEVSVRGIYGYV